jgi:hypothetical protein
MVKDRKVLDYHDVLLYESDLRLLAGEEWLNDQACVRQSWLMRMLCVAHVASRRTPHVCEQCRLPQVINFWFEYLSHEKYASGSVCFVPGATTYLLANAGAPLGL